jgi:uncharacterized protein (TIGR03089 family)
LVTFYDQRSGERTELSATTYANWVAKTASYFVDECDLERGDRVHIELPSHWLGPVFLGACWTVGVGVVAHDADAVVIGPTDVARWSASATSMTVIACALKPLGGRFTDPLPDGIRDFGAEIWSQPDAFYPADPPSADDLATDTTTQGAMITAAQARGLLAPGDRLLATTNPVTDPLDFAEVVVRRGSLVLVANADDEQIDKIASTERVTARA